MIKKLFRYILIAAVGIIVLLMITNPSVKQFKEYVGNPTFENFSISYKRTSNWLIYSTYEFSYTETSDETESFIARQEIISKLNNLKGTYKGFFLNFYKR